MKKHHWKRLFFLLLGVNITAVIILGVFLNMPIEDNHLPDQPTLEGEKVYFQINTNRNDVNHIIEHYIKQERSGNFEYKVFLAEDEVVLSGRLPIFTEMIDLKLTFKPTALENGDLLLEQDQFSIGKLSLPVPILLKLIQENDQFPEWVTIQPNRERIYVSLQNAKLKSNIKLKVKTFDLANDHIEFLYEVPMK